jgi:hypothetical protein
MVTIAFTVAIKEMAINALKTTAIPFPNKFFAAICPTAITSRKSFGGVA